MTHPRSDQASDAPVSEAPPPRDARPAVDGPSAASGDAPAARRARRQADAAGDPAPVGAAGVRVQAPGRLHLGFLDPSGTLGRRFGSLGLVIEDHETVVELHRADRDEAGVGEAAEPDELPRARAHLDAMRRATGCDAPLRLHLARTLPAHAGFGSGTQLALAVGRAFCALFGLALSGTEIARLTGRGLRSGVGIAGFERGGLLLDGGPSASGAPAPILSRVALPPDWRVVLALDAGARGLSGPQERAALAALAPLPRAAAAEICHEVLMRVLPGAACAEFEPFAAGLTRIQRLLGAHFSAAQGGSAYTSAAVGRLVEWIAQHTPAAAGQSSWGPTGFAVLPSAEAAGAVLAAARRAGALDAALDVRTVRARDHGARVTVLPAA